MPSQRIIHIHPEAPAKPALGQPCNGCGVCCLVEPCPLGVWLSRRFRGACAALRWSAPDARYVCGALSEPAQTLGWLGRRPVLRPWIRRWVVRWIASGQGCDATLEVHTPPTR